LPPLGEALRSLAAIERAVDLDRGGVAAGIFQLAPCRELLRIEHAAAPRRIGPASDADADRAGRLVPCQCLILSCAMLEKHMRFRGRMETSVTEGRSRSSAFHDAGR